MSLLSGIENFINKDKVKKFTEQCIQYAVCLASYLLIHRMIIDKKKYTRKLSMLKKLKNKIKAIYHKSFVDTYYVFFGHAFNAYWSNSRETKSNFGDALNSYLIPKVINKNIVHSSKVFFEGYIDKYYFLGSILPNVDSENCIICGAGFKEHVNLTKKPKKILAVRGPLSRQVYLDNNIECPEIYFDPAILLSRYFKVDHISKYDVGIIPHYIDKEKLKNVNIINEGLTYTIIDIEDSIENVINQITKCKYIFSSSLHGIITANSYDIPACWIKLSDKVVGGGFKFHDYYLSLELNNIQPYIIESSIDLSYGIKHSINPDKSKQIIIAEKTLSQIYLKNNTNEL